jgi:glycosyltransferase involved in cell wall biosynthesis
MFFTRATHVIHDLRPGGAEHVLVDLASVARRAGIDLSVVSMLPTEGLRYADALVRAGVRVETLGLQGWWDPRGPRRMRRALADLAPDVVHTHLKHADVIGGRAADRLGIPHISTLHLVEDDSGRVAAWKRDVAMRSRMRTAARTIAVSDALRGWYLDHSGASPEAVITIRNGVPDPGPSNLAEIEAVRRELGIPEHSLMGAMIAVMRPGKGHDILIEAARMVEDPSIVFVLAGDGVEEPGLRAAAASDDRIVFAGFRDDVSRVLAAADFAVHPSLADALPTALIHALAASRPIIASDVGGIPEIVPEHGGLLVTPGDPSELASAIDRLASTADTRVWMGKRGRERYDAEFEAITWAERLRALYGEIVGAE